MQAKSLIFICALSLCVSPLAQAQKFGTKSWSKSGKNGGQASGVVTSKTGSLNSSSTVTGPKGKSASGSTDVTYGRNKWSAKGSYSGPNGGTTTYNGSGTYGNGQVTTNGTLTGPKGKSATNSSTISQNGDGTYNYSGTASTSGGKSKSYSGTTGSKKKQSTSRKRG